MELKIYNPSEDGFLKVIEWNFDELKAGALEKSEEYKTIVYTSDEQIKKEAKADRAKVRKFIDVLESERKRVKKQCMEPYELFEKQIKELTGIMNEAVANIDSQVKAYEERQRQDKLEKVQKIYDETIPEDIRGFVTFEVALVDKYLLSGTSLKTVREGMQALADRVKADMEIINAMPEYVFEATEKYKQTLDLQWAMRTVNDLRDAAERKRIFEEQRVAKEAAYREQQAREAETLSTANRGFEADQPQPSPQGAVTTQQAPADPVYVVELRIHGNRGQLDAFCNFLNDNDIRYDVLAKPKKEA